VIYELFELAFAEEAATVFVGDLTFLGDTSLLD